MVMENLVNENGDLRNEIKGNYEKYSFPETENIIQDLDAIDTLNRGLNDIWLNFEQFWRKHDNIGILWNIKPLNIPIIIKHNEWSINNVIIKDWDLEISFNNIEEFLCVLKLLRTVQRKIESKNSVHLYSEYESFFYNKYICKLDSEGNIIIVNNGDLHLKRLHDDEDKTIIIKKDEMWDYPIFNNNEKMKNLIKYINKKRAKSSIHGSQIEKTYYNTKRRL